MVYQQMIVVLHSVYTYNTLKQNSEKSMNDVKTGMLTDHVTLRHSSVMLA